MTDNPLVNLGELSKPATVLIEKISDAVGGIFKPFQIKRVAEAEAEKIRADSEIVVQDIHRRALHRFLNEEAIQQKNMEDITQKALPDLKENAKPDEIEDDWLFYFFEKCRIISDENVQQAWSRILANEANAPGSFSRKTIDCLQSLDEKDAKLLNALRSFIIRSKNKHILIACVFDPDNDIYKSIGQGFGTLQQLESHGLLTVVFTSFGPPCVQMLDNEISEIEYFDQTIRIIKQKDEATLPVGYIRLTRSGRELAEICQAEPNYDFIEYAISRWKSKDDLKIEIL